MIVMDYVVNKLGGEIAGSAEYSARAIDILRGQLKDGYKPLVVVSAGKVDGIGVTETLKNAFAYLSIGRQQREVAAEYLVKSVMAPLRRVHKTIIESNIRDLVYRQQAASAVSKLMAEMESGFWAAHENPTPENYDRLVYLGEALRASILLEELEEAGMRAVLIEPHDTSVITNNAFGNASVQAQATRDAVDRGIKPLLDDGYVVVEPGFFGRTEDSKIATLGNGGSDSKAVALSIALGGNVYLWKTTPVRSGDPNIVGDTTRIVRRLKYAEAVEAGKIVQPDAILLALRSGKEIEVPDISNPSLCTRIDREGDPEREVKIVSLSAGAKAIGISSPALESIGSYPHHVFAKHGLNVDIMHSDERGRVTVTVAANGVGADFQGAVQELRYMGYDAQIIGINAVRAVGDNIQPRTAAKINDILETGGYDYLIGATPTGHSGLWPCYAKAVVLPEGRARTLRGRKITQGEMLTRELHRKLVMSKK